MLADARRFRAEQSRREQAGEPAMLTWEQLRDRKGKEMVVDESDELEEDEQEPKRLRSSDSSFIPTEEACNRTPRVLYSKPEDEGTPPRYSVHAFPLTNLLLARNSAPQG